MNRTRLSLIFRRLRTLLSATIAAVVLLRVAACGGSVQVGSDHSTATGDAAGTTGGGGVPGSLGANCILGGIVVERQGATGEAQVKTLDRCNEGLSCNSAKICVSMQSCGSTVGGDCVVYSASGAGGSSGTDGGGGTGGTAIGGNTNAMAAVPEPAITGLAADDANLYWITYGTRDNLGNHKNDGAFWSFSFKDGTTTAIASDFHGPVALGVTSTHAYVAIDGAPLIGSLTHPELLRVALSGGTPELVKDNAGIGGPIGAGGPFIGVGSQAAWTDQAVTYFMSASATAPSVLLAQGGWYLATDGLNLYYDDCPCWGVDNKTAKISRITLSGGTPEPLLSPAYMFGVHGDSLYGVEGIDNETGIVLDRAPVTGGKWQRVRALGAGGPASKFKIVGDRLFVDEYPPENSPYAQPDSNRINVLTASLVSDDPPVRVLERAARKTLVDSLWVGTSNALFWSDGNAIYSR